MYVLGNWLLGLEIRGAEVYNAENELRKVFSSSGFTTALFTGIIGSLCKN